MPRASAIALMITALLAPAASTRAALAERASVEELARTSDAVVRGRVVSTQSRLYKGRITTTAGVEVEGLWRGSAPRIIKVRFAGGVVDGVGQRVDGVSELATGEEVVLFLSKSGNVYRINGLAQGKFRVEGKIARPNLEGVQFIGSTAKHLERVTETMSVTELERRVRNAK